MKGIFDRLPLRSRSVAITEIPPVTDRWAACSIMSGRAFGRLAVCSGEPAGRSEQGKLAVCEALVEVTDNGEVHLIPDGIFRATDGRPEDAPHWVFNAELAEFVIADAVARAKQNALVIDYHHQSLTAKERTGAVPAAGWMTQWEFRPGKGLFAVNVEWTDEARDRIRKRELRFASAVFFYEEGTGRVFRLHSAGLTNTPALRGLEPVAAHHQHPHGEKPVNLKKLIELLGLAKDATEEAVLAACGALVEENKKIAGELAVLTEKATGLEGKLAALSETPDPKKYVGIEVVDELRAKVAELSTKVAGSAGDKVEKLVQTALSDGRLVGPKQAEWARGLGKKNLADLEEYLASATPIAALSTTQTEGKPAPGAQVAALAEVEAEVLKNCGISADDYKKAKE